jgi:signal peptidase I
MGKSGRFPTAIMNIFLVTGLAAIWMAFAPVQLGGQVSYVVVNGISMEPNYHTGDLVLVRQAAAYQVGDVVTYHDTRMNANVIHRIIDIEGNRFVLQGDNNSWIDAARPTADEILGKLWIYLPKFGKAMLWVKAPLNMALAAGLFGGLFTVNITMQKPDKNGKKKRKTASIPAGFEMGLYICGILGLIFLGLFIFAFSRPVLTNADRINYGQTGDFFYSAAVAPGVYDTDSVRSGDPVFTKLTCSLDLGFVYFLAGDHLENISGSQRLEAVMLDQQSGWKRTIPLSTSTKFKGNTYTTKAVLDLCQLEDLVASVQEKTGLRLNNYMLDISALVSVQGKISGQAFTDTFEPHLVFHFVSLRFYVVKESSNTNPLHTLQEGSLASTAKVDNTLQLFGLKPAIRAVRVVALAGLVVSLAGLLGLGLYFYKASQRSPAAVIGIKYGPILMDVQEQGLERLSPIIEVTTIEDMARLAERQSAMLMHLVRDGVHYYFVQTEGTTYRYVAGMDQPVDSRPDQSGIELAAIEEDAQNQT